MGNIKENILVNFSRKSKYTSDTSFVGIKFGADAQLTELELIELQEILRGQITSSLKNLIGDKFLKEKPECIYADKVITLKKGKMLIQGYYAEADNLVLKDVVNGDYIAVKGEIVEIKHSDNIPKWGNNSEASNIVILPNYIQDEDLKGETSRRYQLVFKLVKVKPDSQGKVDGLLVGHIVNSKLILDAPVADFDSLNKDITEVGDILRKELKDLQEDLSMHKNDASRIEREIREILENYSTTLNGYTEEHNKIHIELDKVLKTKINESDAIKLIDEHAKLKKEIVEVLPNPLDAKPNTIYLVKKEDGKDGDFYNEYVIIDKKFELIGNTSLDLTGYAKKTDIPERLGQLEDDLKLQESIKGLSDGKVDKVTGKQLSTNDYTTAEKDKLAKLENYDDTSIKADIAKKADTLTVNTNLSKKVDKVTGKQLSTNDYTTTEKNKLSKLNNYDDTDIKADISKKVDKANITSDLEGIDENKVLSQKGASELNKKFDSIRSSRAATIVIANYNSTEKSKKGADYVVKKGEDASKIIMTAEQELVGFGGKILLMEGKYDCQSGIVLGYAETILEGCNATLVQNKNWSKTKYGDGKTSNDIIGNYKNMESIIVNNVKIVGKNVGDSRGIYCGGSSQISNCTISSTGDDGIYCGDSSQASNCTVSGTTSSGIYCSDSSQASNCTVSGTTSSGIYCSGSSQISNCTVSGAGTSGMFCTQSSQISNCTISGTGNDYGITCSDSSQISNCTVSGTTSGIYCSDSSQISNCTISSTGDNGIFCTDSSQASNCTVSGATSYGTYCSKSFKGIYSFNILKNCELRDDSSTPSKVQYNVIQ